MKYVCEFPVFCIVLEHVNIKTNAFREVVFGVLSVHKRIKLNCFVVWKCSPIFYVLVRGKPVINLTN
jgi:hypothetical protein